MSTHTFTKENGAWHIDCPRFLQQIGNEADFTLLQGAKRILDFIAKGATKMTITMDTQPLEKAGILQLVELGDASKGGGYYQVLNNEGKLLKRKLWLCDVTLFVFGDIPERIYIRRDEVCDANGLCLQ